MSALTALTQETLIAIRKKLLSKEITAQEATQACLDRIAESDSAIHAFITVRDNLADDALADACALDAQGPDPSRPLWGVPISVKDVIMTKGTRTTAASRMLESFVPFYDAHVITLLKKAGAVILGKTNMDEFAMGSSTENSAFGPTKNPCDLERIPGGSSGGSAASVVACQAFASLGSDTGGSIRQPAALCGCFGLKPTYGRVSRYGLIAYGSSLDQIGPFGRSVEDVAVLCGVISGHDSRDSTSADRSYESPEDLVRASQEGSLKGRTLGIPQEFFGEGLDAGVAKVCQETMDRARSLGAKLVNVSLPHSTRHAIATYYILAMAEASSNLSRFDGVRYGYRTKNIHNLDELYTLSRSQGFGHEVQRRILLGTYVLSAGYYDAYYRKAAQVRRLIRQDYLDALAQCDAILAPVSPVPAWKLGTIVDDPLQMYLMDIYTVSLNLAGLPGLAFPAGECAATDAVATPATGLATPADGLSGRTLPVGMQLLGRAFDERTLLAICGALVREK